MSFEPPPSISNSPNIRTEPRGGVIARRLALPSRGAAIARAEKAARAAVAGARAAAGTSRVATMVRRNIVGEAGYSCEDEHCTGDAQVKVIDII